jgi:hypothetical protein
MPKFDLAAIDDSLAAFVLAVLLAALCASRRLMSVLTCIFRQDYLKSEHLFAVIRDKNWISNLKIAFSVQEFRIIKENGIKLYIRPIR